MPSIPDTIHVLYVDDGGDIAETSASNLERKDERLSVLTESTVDDALDTLSNERVDCIVSAYEMPTQDGIEFLESVRGTYPDLPFILYTDNGSEEVASEAISNGVTDYLPKDSRTDHQSKLADRIRDAVTAARAEFKTTGHNLAHTVVREINDALARATTRSEIDEHVCQIIADAEPYRFAWIGEHDAESRIIEPRFAAGIGDEYLENVEITTDESPTGRGPTGRAVKNREVAVMQNIPEDPEYEPWREEALERGYRSSAAVPIVYEDTLYGVLNVYSDRIRAFDERERELLSNLGDTIAHSYHRIELQHQYTEQYRVLFDEAPVMVAFTEVVDGEPIIDDCNQAFADRLGYSQSELQGTPLAEYYSEESADELLGENGYQRALTGEFVREQRTLVTREGEEVLTVLRAVPRRDPDGEIIGTQGIYLDITEEKQVQELEWTNALLSTLFDALPVGIIVEDDSREVLTTNQRMFDLFAFPGSPEDIVGADCGRLAEEVSEQFENSERFLDRTDRLVATREAVDNEEFTLADGRTVERSYRPIELPESDANLWVYRDVTERTERETELRNLKNRFELAVDGANLGVWDWNMQTDEVEFNEQWATMIGHSPEEIEPHLSEWERRVHPADEGDVDAALSDHIEGRTDYYDCEHRLGTADGDWKWIRDIGRVVDWDEDGEPKRAVGIHLDIDDRKRREQELERQNERLDAFTSIVSHDLRNPLSVAQGRLELAREECDNEHIDHVHRMHDRIESLIEDLLTLAREGKTVTDPDPVDLVAIVENCFGTVETADATVVTDLDRRVLADESRLKQVFENLFRNAVEHGGEDVVVTVGELDDGFYLEDDGPGIPEDEREQVFEAGYSSSRNGTGFGLSIVKEIVEAHEWGIRVTESTDGGARFEITGVEFAST
ncbi:multi-sensor signal transduction histidine kinase [Halalkaliarchaeum desulfuricum]|uniref:histidine kinase n=1 Tax=Halalkaliarchaeum desulfuricum TaxID=2055893 RepID=A0A343TLX5_9EURY|nr:PAS domain S-box protein [Halalkaliarchaeum desulfuricum]AUX10097.1 multi-sensor signal transduction histidine kinase [Halalkaliarchaeum desulfuricum]